MAGTDEAVLRRARVLFGFMTEQEAQAFVASQVAGDWSTCRDKWAAAVAARQALPPDPWDAPEILDLSPEAQLALVQLRATPAYQQFAQAAGGVEIKLIEIDKLAVFQQQVDVQFSEDGAGPALGNGDPVEQARLAFPMDSAERVSVGLDQVTQSVVLSSLTRNIATTQFGLVPGAPGQINVMFQVTIGANWIAVSEYGGRYYLRNGYHRTWLLRQRGMKHVPAIIMHANSWNEVMPGPGFFAPPLLSSATAPRFAHFFADGVAPEVLVKSQMAVIRISSSRMFLSRLP